MRADTLRIIRRSTLPLFLCGAALLTPAAARAWTDTGGGDHGGADWTISANTVIAGTHTNVGTFTINSGITATVQALSGTSFGTLAVYAGGINIAGALNANGAGFGRAQGPGKASGTFLGSSGCG